MLAAALSASTSGIVITDPRLPDNRIVYVNPAFERTTGYSAGEVVGGNCRFLQGDDREQPDLDGLRAAVREGREGHAVLRDYRKGGSRSGTSSTSLRYGTKMGTSPTSSGFRTT